MPINIKKHIYILFFLFSIILFFNLYATYDNNNIFNKKNALAYKNALFANIQNHLVAVRIEEIQKDLAYFSTHKYSINYFKKLKLKFYNSSKSINQFVKSELYKNFLKSHNLHFNSTTIDYQYIDNMFLVDNYGNVLYTLFKSKKLGKKLKRPAYMNTLLASAFRETMEQNKINFFKEDSNVIIAAPLIDTKGIKIGVIALSLKYEELIKKSMDEVQLLHSLQTFQKNEQEQLKYSLYLYLLSILLMALYMYYIFYKIYIAKSSQLKEVSQDKESQSEEKEAQEKNAIQNEQSEAILWNEKEALQRFGNSKEALMNIIPLFISDTLNQLADLEEAIEKENFSKIKMYAHTIKGSSSNLSADKLSFFAQTIEITTTAKDMKSIHNSYIQLKKYWNETFQILNEYLKDNKKNSNIHLSKTRIASSLERIRSSLEKGDFIDTSECSIFNISISKKLDLQFQLLKNEIDKFETHQATMILNDIIQELNNESEDEE